MKIYAEFDCHEKTKLSEQSVKVTFHVLDVSCAKRFMCLSFGEFGLDLANVVIT